MVCTSTDDVRFFRSKETVFVLRNLPGAARRPRRCFRHLRCLPIPRPSQGEGIYKIGNRIMINMINYVYIILIYTTYIVYILCICKYYITYYHIICIVYNYLISCIIHIHLLQKYSVVCPCSKRTSQPSCIAGFFMVFQGYQGRKRTHVSCIVK